MNIRKQLDKRIAKTLSEVVGFDTPALLAPAGKPEFGDYQANGVMAAAKRAKINPRELAQKLIDALEISDLAGKLEIAGPGFINITLKSEFLTAQANEAVADERLGIPATEIPKTVVIDYSSPNLAKEMHVGHLRSTIIGDALARVLEFCGHDVKRQNHVGDWGTQFGMLIAYVVSDAKIIEHDDLGKVISIDSAKISDLEDFYRRAKQEYDTNPEFAKKARDYVVKLQSGDEFTLAIWEWVTEQSLEHAEEVYELLGVTLKRGDVYGESAYNNDLPKVVEDLKAAGLLTESDGAQCVFLDQFKGKDDEPLPVIVQKTGGGYLYATTDLAAMRYRSGELSADRILYVTDARQALHFQQVFAVAKVAGFVPESVSLEHIGFGVMTGSDRKPFKTREGGTVKLMDLLTQAQARAIGVVEAKNPELTSEQKDHVARVVGIGAVKYADLSQNRSSDYVFSWDKMLAFEGNTAPYMQYAYARIRSIFRKGGVDFDTLTGEIVLAEPAERLLAVKALQLAETIETVSTEGLPNLLCNYLFDLANAFMSFYESCPVLPADEPTRTSRLMLCKLTANVIDCGLGLLGIDTLEQM